MPGPGNELTVEERLERARLLPRVGHDVLNMCKSVDQLLHAQHISNLAQAVVCVQELARDHYAVVIALKWVVLLVDMLESDNLDVRLATCSAIAAVSMVQEGRDAVRSSGGLRPLVMLLAEGSRSAVAAAAAMALMNCSACDTCKEAIADCRGVPQLLALIRDTIGRCDPAGNSGGPVGGGSSSGSGVAPEKDLRSPGDCKAAVYGAGALMNMGGVISVQEKLMAAGAVPIFETVLRISAPGDVVATRANFMLSWLAVASGATSGASERRGHHHHRNRSTQGDDSSRASTPRSGWQQPSSASPQSSGLQQRPSSGGSTPPQQQQQPPQQSQQPQQPQPSTGKPAVGSAVGGSRAGASKPTTPSGGGSGGKGTAVVTGRA